MSVQEIWESCLEKIKDAIPEICYATWFKDLEPAELFQDILFIRFPDDGKYDFQVFRTKFGSGYHCNIVKEGERGYEALYCNATFENLLNDEPDPSFADRRLQHRQVPATWRD